MSVRRVFFAAGQQPVRRIGGPRLKISLNAYSLNGMLTAPSAGGKPARTLFDVLDFCARENFDDIDPTGYDPSGVSGSELREPPFTSMRR